MSNKVYVGFIVLFVLAVGTFLYVRKAKGGFEEVKLSRLAETRHEIRGFYLEGSFKQEKGKNQYDQTERALIETYALNEVAVFYYLNPTEENREEYKVFLGEELKNGEGSLPDSLEKRTFTLKNVIKGVQKSSPQFNTVADKIKTSLEDSCAIETIKCETLLLDSIFEKYSREGVTVEMQIE